MKKFTISLAALFMSGLTVVQAQTLQPAAPHGAQLAKAAAATSFYHVDSICTVQMDGTPLSKQVPVYDGDGQMAELYEYAYRYPGDDSMPEAIPSGKAVYSYTAGGVQQKQDTYTYAGDDYLLTEQVEVTTFWKDDDSLPLTTVYSRRSGQQLLPYLQVVTTQVRRGHVEKYEAYVPQDGEWQLFGTGQMEYDADGLTTKETVEMDMGDYTMTEVVAYEYDRHQTATRVTVTVSVMGHVMQSEEVTYENTYDERDLLVKQQTVSSTNEPTISHLYWGGNGTTTGIAATGLQQQARQRSYDLGGRPQQEGRPSQPGIRIAGGKKLLVR